MIKKINKKIWTKNNFFYLTGTLVILSLGMIGYSLQSTNALNNATWVRKQAVLHNGTKKQLHKTLIDANAYNAHFKKISQNPNGEDVSEWFDNPTAPAKYPELTAGTTLITLFQNEKIANAVYGALKNVDPNFSSSGVFSVVTKDDIAKVKELNLANLELTEVNYLLFNENLKWTNLTSINLSNNNFSDYQLIFNKKMMPKLWKITARNSQLKYMVDVSSYVTDPYDQTHDFLSGDPARSADDSNQARKLARVEYDKPLINNVPRYFDVANNDIRFIPKYYLKIALGYLDVSNNQLGLGSASDPLGYYAIPSYSGDTKIVNKSLDIPDPELKGPYGMNIYLTGDRKTNPFTDDAVARWRAQPFPIKSLRFTSYNPTPDNDGNMDSGVDKDVFKRPTGVNLNQTTNNIKLPYFNFAINKLNNIPVFLDAISSYDSLSSTRPQNKNNNIYVGLDEWKASTIYNDTTKKDRYNRFQDVSAFDTDGSYNSFFDYSIADLKFDSAQQDRGFQYRGIEVVPRSFNGYDMFMIDKDSRTISNSNSSQWAFKNWYSGINSNNTNLSALAGTTKDEIEFNKGVKWDPYGISLNNVTVDNDLKVKLNEFWGVDYEKNFGGNTNNNVNAENLMGRSIFLRSYVNTHLAYLLKGNRDNVNDRNVYLTPNSEGAHLFYDYATTRRTGLATFGNFGLKPGRSPLYNYFAESLTPENSYASSDTWKGFSTINYSASGRSIPILHRKNSFVTNLKGTNSFGIKQDLQPPYYSQFSKNFGGLDGYNYSNNYIVLQNLNSDFKNYQTKENIFVKDITMPLMTNGSSLKSKYVTDNNELLVAQAITNADFKNGRSLFWNSEQHFDVEYMKVIDPNDIELVFDDETGELIFKFRVYSPGYSTLGRLLRMDDNNDPDATKTLDFWVINKVKGFTPTGLWYQGDGDNSNLISSKNYATNISFKAPAAIKDTSLVNIDAKKIAKLFETNYLGNKLIPTFNTNLVEFEKTQGQKSELDAEWVNITRYNPEEGEIEFKIDIPNYRFINGNWMNFPQNFRDATFVLNGFTKLEVSYIGAENRPFEEKSFSDQDKNKYKQLITKAASEITALDIFQANVIVSNRTDWKKMMNDSANAEAIFTNLTPNNTTGTLSFFIRLPGDEAISLSSFIKQVTWKGFLNTTTQANWISQEELTQKFPSLNPTQLKAKFKADPLAFFKNFENSYQDETVAKDDILFEDSNFFINDDTGDFRVLNFLLKKFKRNGVNETPNIPSNYLNLGASPNYKGTLPPSVATWISQDEAKNQLLNAFVQRQLITSNNNVTPNIDLEQRKNQLTATEAKAFLLKSNFNFELLFSSLKNLSIRNIQFKNGHLANSLTADNEKGTLVLHDVSFQDWRNADNSLSLHTIEPLTINFNKITTSFAWSDLLPLALRLQNPQTFEQTFTSRKLVSDFVAKLDMGVKVYDNEGNLKTNYRVNLDKVTLNTYSGILEFAAGAVIVSPQYTDGKEVAIFSSPAKTYNLTITSSTRVIANQEIATTTLTENKKLYLQFVNPGLQYDNLNQEEQSFYDNQYEALKPINLNGISANEAVKALQKWQTDNNKTTISVTDLAKINTLKTSNSATTNIDFANFSYVPEFMFYTTKPNLDNNDPNRTYIIAKSFEVSSLQQNDLIFKDVYIVNNYQNKVASLTLFAEAVIFYNFNQTTFLNFKDDPNQPGYKLLEPSWKAQNAAEVAAELQYLFDNQNRNEIVNFKEFNEKTSKWRTMFNFGLVPNNGISDPVIAYPAKITFDLYQKKVRIDQLLFPLYFVNEFGKLPQPVTNITRDYGQNAVFKVDGGEFNSHVVSTFNKPTEEIAGQSMDQLLNQWGLRKGTQSDPVNTYNLLNDHQVLKINGDKQDLFNPAASKQPTAQVGQIDVDIQITNNKGFLKFSQIQIKDGWFNGQQNSQPQSVNDVIIEFDLVTTQAIPKKSLQGAIALVYQDLAINTYGSYNIHNALLLWQKDLIDFNNIQAQQRALKLVQEMHELKGTVIENGIEKTYLAFEPLNTSSIDQTRSKQVSLIRPNSVGITFTPTNIIITIQNLSIFHGLQESQEVTQRPIPSSTLILANDYSTNFNNKQADQKINEILKSNNLNNGDVSKIQNFFNDNSQLLLNSLFQASSIDFGEQSDVPIITVSTNDLFGQAYITIYFKNFYVAGVDVGERTFQYTFSTSTNKLPIVIGSSVAGFVVLSSGILGFVIWKKRQAGLSYVKKKKL